MKYPTYYDTVVNNPLWKKWVELNEVEPRLDVHESIETGWLSDKHFAAFLEWVQERGRREGQRDVIKLIPDVYGHIKDDWIKLDKLIVTLKQQYTSRNPYYSSDV